MEKKMIEKIPLTEVQIAARSPAYSYQDLLDKETNDVPDALRSDTAPYLGSEELPIERWTSREFHDLEVEKLWSKTWQMACRESQVAKAGDYFVYDIVDRSVVITRTQDGELKAHHNSCLHRGRALKRGAGKNATELRCPYHGFTWELSGEFREMPCKWDFPHIDTDEFSLPGVRVDTWGGWVFVNFDDDAKSLEEYMGILPEHFKRWPAENRHIAMHVEKVINVNWKAAVEAFIESYHATSIHPQIMSYQGIDNSQYDVWGDHISRTITTYATINPSHADMYSEQDSVNTMLGLEGEIAPENQVEGHLSARHHVAELNYETFSEMSGRDLKEFATEAEMMDSILYFVFPNFAPWAGYHSALTYRHRPNGDDHESCIMDIFLLNPFPEGAERPQDAVTVRLGADEPFSNAADVMGESLAKIFDQDGANLPQVQRGMKASKAGKVNLANYQEVRIRHFHQTLDKYLKDS
ncbi:MAG: phenylpropionate dioxygenase-like ring-hydroxylating dioxygenase large terminal subunit [Halieaceae bacterium]|jgi:phenylpropionate dioxygenase-like ring-hydroxylating dioxygenase large terminal subunit